MTGASKLLAEIPTQIDIKQDWLVRFRASELGISESELVHIVKKVGPELADVEKYLDAGVTIAIRDTTGQLRRATKIIPLKNGVAISVPYHSAKEGWLFEHPMMYDRTVGQRPISELIHFTASDRVKLSIHFGGNGEGGLAHFSRGGKQDIISGYDEAMKKAKGLGVVAPHPINITSGPLFAVIIRKIEECDLLGERPAEIFEPEDLWFHPRHTTPTSTNYCLEGFMLPKKMLSKAKDLPDKRIVVSTLPFIGLVQFPFHLRIVELPHLDTLIGLILHKMDSEGSTGYVLSGPGSGPPGEEKRGISAWYPRPDFVDKQEGVKSLDKPPKPKAK